MKKNLKFSVIVNLNASGGKNLSLINEVIKLLKRDYEVKVFKTYNKDQAKNVFKSMNFRNSKPPRAWIFENPCLRSNGFSKIQVSGDLDFGKSMPLGA